MHRIKSRRCMLHCSSATHLLHHESASAQLIIAHTRRNAQSRKTLARPRRMSRLAGVRAIPTTGCIHSSDTSGKSNSEQRATPRTNTIFTSRGSLNSFATSCSNRNISVKKHFPLCPCISTQRQSRKQLGSTETLTAAAWAG